MGPDEALEDHAGPEVLDRLFWLLGADLVAQHGAGTAVCDRTWQVQKRRRWVEGCGLEGKKVWMVET